MKNRKTLLIKSVLLVSCSWKAFDTMDHDLLIAKLGAYGSQEDALVFYFMNRQQRVHVNSNFSVWETLVENSDSSNCADDNTLHSSANDLEQVKQTVRQRFE